MTNSGTTGSTLTIVIATYNCASDLESCLSSIYAQTYPHIEIVISDGGSTDGTVDVIEAHADRLGGWLSEPDKGIYDAWNKALPMVSGEWVYFLGADDTLYDPDSIAQAMTALDQIPEGALVAYAQTQFVRTDGTTRIMGEPWDETRRQMRAQMALPHQAVFHAHALFDRFGGFDGTFQIAGDYKLIMTSLQDVDPVFLGPIIIANQHAGGKSGLRRNRVSALREFRAVQKDLGLPMSPAWLWSFAKGLIWWALSQVRNVGAGS